MIQSEMVVLRCPVRGCGLALTAIERRYACPRGHSFDRARSGYLSLLQPQDRRSRRPGDGREVVAARQRWLERGAASALLAALDRRVEALALPSGAAALDVGCGEGFALRALGTGRRLEIHGIDLSSAAVAAAARLQPEALFVVANADRGLPYMDGSFDLLLSIDARRPGAEMHRVLRPGSGRLLVAVPAADDLAELRALVLGRALERDRWPALEAALAPWFIVEQKVVTRQVLHLDRDGLADALAVTYRGARRRERDRLAATEALAVTVSHQLSCWRPRAHGIARPGRVLDLQA